MISHSVIAVTVAMRSHCPAKHPSPKKSPLDRDDRFVPLLGNDGYFYLALLDVENGVSGFTLREDDLAILVF